MSEYLILIYNDETSIGAQSAAEATELHAAHGVFAEKHGSVITAGAALQASGTASTIQVGDGSLAVTDGPFVETKEALGGFYLIDVPDLDAALAVAKDVPAPFGGVELRPVMVLR
jgi:hypothetical protein